MKLCVPSIGSMYQQDPGAPLLRPEFLADDPVVRVGSRDPAPDRRLDGGVGLGHEGPVGLGLDHEVAPEMLERDRVGLVAARQREGEPRAAGVGRGVGFGVGHERILAPSGS